MARSIEEIMNQMLEAKNAEPALSQLNSTSKVSLFRLMMYVFATAIHYTERTWEIFKVDLEKIADEANVGTAKWLQRKTLEYQDGSTLIVSGDTVKYSTVDLTKRIITRCSVKENNMNRGILVKVAKAAGGDLIKLSDTEIAGLRSYLTKLKMAGTKISISSLDADMIQVYAKVYYNPSYLPSEVKTSIITAINAYFKNLDFSGNIYLSKLTDVIQSCEGVQDVVLDNVRCRMATDNVADAVAVERLYESYAGYVLAEDTPGFDLSNTIELIPFE